MASNKVRITQRAVVVRAADSPRIATDERLDNAYRVQGHSGGQETYPVGIAYVETGSERVRDRWDTFLAAHPECRIMYGGTDAKDYAGRDCVQLIGENESHRSRRKQGAYCTAYRVAFLTADAQPALDFSGLLARPMHFDAPAPVPRGGKTDYPHGRLHPSQINSQKDAKRCAHVITGASLATVREVTISAPRIKPDKLERARAADPYTTWESGTYRDMPFTNAVQPSLEPRPFLTIYAKDYIQVFPHGEGI